MPRGGRRAAIAVPGAALARRCSGSLLAASRQPRTRCRPAGRGRDTPAAPAVAAPTSNFFRSAGSPCLPGSRWS